LGVVLQSVSSSSRFNSVLFNSHLFWSPIGARTLKMPVPYPPPSVGAYTRTPSHQPLLFGRKCTDHLPYSRSDDLVVPRVPVGSGYFFLVDQGAYIYTYSNI